MRPDGVAACSGCPDCGDVPTRLVAYIAEGIHVLARRDSIPITHAQCEERARNIATHLLTEFDISDTRGPHA